jgi:hypothetical protein
VLRLNRGAKISHGEEVMAAEVEPISDTASALSESAWGLVFDVARAAETGVYPSRIDQFDTGRGAAANDVNMLVCTGGRQRSEAEFRSLQSAAE